MAVLITNIDDVRAEIMRLENEPVFDTAAWLAVLQQMQDRPSGLADARRRMMTAYDNATMLLDEHLLWKLGVVGVDPAQLGADRTMILVADLGCPGESIELTLVPVAVETDK